MGKPCTLTRFPDRYVKPEFEMPYHNVATNRVIQAITPPADIYDNNLKLRNHTVGSITRDETMMKDFSGLKSKYFKLIPFQAISCVKLSPSRIKNSAATAKSSKYNSVETIIRPYLPNAT